MKLAFGVALLAALVAPPGLELGKDVPDFTAKDLNGKEYKLSALKDKVVVVFSWSFDCGSGKPVIGRATDVAKKYEKDESVVFLAVNSYGETPEKLKAYCKDNSISYAVCHDEGKSIAKMFNAKQVNSCYVIKEGKLFWRGGLTQKGDDLGVDAIEAAKAGKAAPESDKKFAG